MALVACVCGLGRRPDRHRGTGEVLSDETGALVPTGKLVTKSTTPLSRRYALPTIKRLHTLSGNQCAAPGCSRQLIARDGQTIVSKICHIEAASPEGPRWNRAMSDEARRHFSNLILLCDECHSIIDNKENEGEYPVDLLRKWKSDHESQMTYSVLAKHPSLLGAVVDAIADADLDAPLSIEAPQPAFDITEKLTHNDVVRGRALIDEYKVWYPKVSQLYDALEEQGSFKKDKLLRNVRQVYLKVKGRYVGASPDSMTVVRQHADDILDEVLEELTAGVEITMTRCPEDAAFAVSVLVVDAFMRCKILEPPPS